MNRSKHSIRKKILAVVATAALVVTTGFSADMFYGADTQAKAATSKQLGSFGWVTKDNNDGKAAVPGTLVAPDDYTKITYEGTTKAYKNVGDGRWSSDEVAEVAGSKDMEWLRNAFIENGLMHSGGNWPGSSYYLAWVGGIYCLSSNGDMCYYTDHDHDHFGARFVVFSPSAGTPAVPSTTSAENPDTISSVTTANNNHPTVNRGTRTLISSIITGVTGTKSGYDGSVGEENRTGHTGASEASMAYTVSGDFVEAGGDALTVPANFAGDSFVLNVKSANSNSNQNITIKVNVTPVSTSDLNITGIPDQIYTSSEIRPEVNFSAKNGTKFTKGVDYDISYSNNINVGTATATINFKLRYKGEVDVHFNISPATINSISDIESSYQWRGTAIQPNPTVKVNNRTLVKDTDYIVSYGANTDIGTGTVSITGIGNYTGGGQKTFTIVPVPLNDANVKVGNSADTTNYTYTGSPLPAQVNGKYPFTVKLTDSTPLYEGEDYTVSFRRGNNTDHTNVGTVTAVFTFKGHYEGTATHNFDITPHSVADKNAHGLIELIEFCAKHRGDISSLGPDKFPKAYIIDTNHMLVKDKDYEIKCNDDSTILTGKGNYKDSVVISKQSSENSSGRKVDYSTNKIIVTVADQTYQGGAQIAPSIGKGVTVDANERYTVTDIHPMDNYTNANIASADQGMIQKYPQPEIEFNAKLETFNVEHLHIPFNIVPYTLKDENVTLSLKYQDTTYTGWSIKPRDITVAAFNKQLIECTDKNHSDGDYWIEYGKNTDAGTGIVKIHGVGNYTGTVEKTFDIPKRDISEFYTATANDTIWNYGNPANGTVVVKDVAGNNILTDGNYEVIYSNNINATPPDAADNEKAKATISGKGNYEGTIEAYYNIGRRQINEKDITYTPSVDWTNHAPIKTDVTIRQMEDDGITEYTFTEGTEYTLKWGDNKTLGEGTVHISGTGNLIGEFDKKFTIVRVDLTNDERLKKLKVEATDNEWYFGMQVKPALLSITYDDTLLTEGTDYQITYGENKNVTKADGTDKGTVHIEFIGNYKGSTDTTFNIVPRSLSTHSNEVTVDYTAEKEWNRNGDTIPEVTSVTMVDNETPVASHVLSSTDDYDVTYANNKDISTNDSKGHITITGKGNYTGSITKDFTVKPVTILEQDINVSETAEWKEGSGATPSITVNHSGIELTPNTDYTITYSNNTAVGATGTVEIQGTGHYTGGPYIKQFTVVRSLTNDDVVITNNDFGTGKAKDYIYTGQPLPESKDSKYPFTVKLKKEGIVLAEGTDYDVSFTSDNSKDTTGHTDVGNVTATFNFKAPYKGSATDMFTISPRSIIAPDNETTGLTELLDWAKKPENNRGTAPELVINKRKLVSGTDYKLTAEKTEKDSTSVIEGIGNYCSSVTSIDGNGRTVKKYDGGEITASTEAQTYTSLPIIPELVIKADKDTFEASVEADKAKNNINANLDANNKLITDAPRPTAVYDLKSSKIRLRNFTMPFNIQPATLTEKDIDISDKDDMSWTGREIKRTVKVTSPVAKDTEGRPLILKEGKDYTVSYEGDLINAGKDTVKITITGIGNYKGGTAKTYSITGHSMDKENVIVKAEDATWDHGSPVTPPVTVTWNGKQLDPQTDYDLAYRDNTNVGTGKVEVTFKGNYTGTKEATFTISPIKINPNGITDIPAQKYTGKPIEPGVEIVVTKPDGTKVKLVEGEDYTIDYENNTEPGTATAVIRGVPGDHYDFGEDGIRVDFTIKSKPITKTENIPLSGDDPQRVSEETGDEPSYTPSEPTNNTFEFTDDTPETPDTPDTPVVDKPTVDDTDDDDLIVSNDIPKVHVYPLADSDGDGSVQTEIIAKETDKSAEDGKTSQADKPDDMDIDDNNKIAAGTTDEDPDNGEPYKNAPVATGKSSKGTNAKAPKTSTIPAEGPIEVMLAGLAIALVGIFTKRRKGNNRA